MVSKLIYDSLFDYCKWGQEFNNRTKKLLESNDDIDVLLDEGQLLRFAVKNSNLELFNILIDYYKEHILEPVKARSNEEYNVALFRLAKALELIPRKMDIQDPEIEKIVNRYTNYITQDNDASSDTTSLGDEDVSNFAESDNEDSGCSFNSTEDYASTNTSSLTSENLEKLNESLVANCKLEPNVDLSGYVQNDVDTYDYYAE